MEDYIYNHRKPIGIVLGALILILVGVGVFKLIWNSIYSAEVNIIVTPSIAEVKIGDGIYKANGEYRLIPGEYDVEISAEGFKTKNGRLVAVGGETVKLAVFLEPDEDNSDWYDTHQEDNLILGEIKNSETIESLQKLGKQYPILDILPYNVEYFTDNYSRKVKYSITYQIEDNENGFVIIVDDYMGGARELAYRWLESNGVDTDDVIIEYNDISEEWRATGSAK